MANRVVITKALAGSGATKVCASQTPSAGNMLINGTAASGGVATLDTQRRVLFTFAADESGHSFVLYGTNQAGTPIYETIAGTTAGTVASLLDYLTVTRISISANATGAITVGTNGVGSTPWININYQSAPVAVTAACVVSGTVNYTVEMTYDNFWTAPQYWTSITAPTTPTAWSDPNISAKTASADTTINDPVTGVRLTINSSTAPGSVTMTLIQAGVKEAG